MKQPLYYPTKFPSPQIIFEIELPIKPLSKSEIQSVIGFLFAEKVSTMEIRRRLIAIYDENLLSVQIICK